MEEPVRRWQLLQWAIVITVIIVGLALFIYSAPAMIVVSILAGYFLSEWILVLLFQLPLDDPVMVWLLTEV